jgi:hypothetical protein
MLLCIYCQEESFDLGKGSEEHAILSSLGGRKASRNICCQECNNRLGDEIDKPFSEEYAFFSTMFDITTGRNKDAPTQKEATEHDGLTFDRKPGGQFRLSKSTVSLDDRPDGTSSISIVAASEQQALSLIENVLKRYGKSIDDFQSIEAKSIKSYIPTQQQKLSLGGATQFRAVAKMLLTYLATRINPERLRSRAFEQVIAYIDGRNDSFSGTALGAGVPIHDIPRLSEISHRAIIMASREKRLTIGVLELFGNIRYTVELSSNWDGPDMAIAYSIDPVDQTSNEDDFEVNLSTALTGYNSYVSDKISIVDGIENVVRAFQDRQTKVIIASITNTAVEDHMVSKGDVITKEMIVNTASKAALEFVRFQERLDSEETIDLLKKKP